MRHLTMVDQASQTTDPAAGANGTFVAIPDADQPAVPAAVAGEPDAPEAAASAASDSTAEPVNDDLLVELARAMHKAATSQYERMNAELERRRTEHVQAIGARDSSDVESLNAGSEAEISAIDGWAKAESEKIELERLRRIDARRQRLAVQLQRQETIKEREILAIEGAIHAHRNEIDLFFGRMERETDPTAIAKLASTLPALPPLAEIAEVARRGAAAEFAALEAEAAPAAAELAVAEPAGASVETDDDATVSEARLMAVMDPDASSGDSEVSRPWEAPYAVSVAAGPADEGAAEPEATSRKGSTLLRTVRAIRPMSGHDRDSGEQL